MIAISLQFRTTALALLLADAARLFHDGLNEYEARKQAGKRHSHRQRRFPAFRPSVRPVRHAVLRHQLHLGILAAGDADDAGDHDPAAHPCVPLRSTFDGFRIPAKARSVWAPDACWYSASCFYCCGSRHPVRCYPRYRTHKSVRFAALIFTAGTVNRFPVMFQSGRTLLSTCNSQVRLHERGKCYRQSFCWWSC